MIKAIDLALESELKDNKDLGKFMTDSIAHTFEHRSTPSDQEWLSNKDYAALCSSSPVDQTNEYLFGDLSKLAKDMTDAKCVPQPTG